MKHYVGRLGSLPLGRALRGAAVVVLFALVMGGPPAAAVAQLPDCPEGAGAGAVHEDLAYAALPRNRLDLYTSADESSAPLFIWVHGGAWRRGSKSPIPESVNLLNERGYAVASVEYRLSKWPWPAQIADIKAAIRWLRANASDYGLAAGSFAIGGASAGGHLAALAGTSAGEPALENLSQGNAQVESTVQAVCDFFGPTNFLLADAQAYEAGCGAEALCAQCPCSPQSELLDCCPVIAACPQKVAQANPITYIDSEDPPFFIAHGGSDCTIPIGQSEILAEALSSAGVEAGLEVVPNAGHSMNEVATQKVVIAMIEFLDRHLRGCKTLHDVI